MNLQEKNKELQEDIRALRPALYHRFHALLPLVAHPLARRGWRAAGWLALIAYFAFAALILTLRHSILPNIEQYRPAIEQKASEALGLPVSIGSIRAGWDGLRPDLTLADVAIADKDGRPALAFSRVEAVLSWTSLLTLEPRLALLAIDEPILHVRRNANGSFEVGGIAVAGGAGDSDLSDWVLGQGRIRINGATLVWEDGLRGAPQLVLEDVNLALDNDGNRHRFGLSALPPAALASRIDIRANLQGDDLVHLDDWKGQLFTELDYVDLAGWRQWIDYPVALPQGRGAIRAWLAVAEGRLLNLTADVALEDVRLQLSRKLPELRLASLNGRLGGSLRRDGFSVSGKQLTFTVQAGETLPATDFGVDWRLRGEGLAEGSATASRLDLGLLARFSAYLPLDAATRKLLDDYAPGGEISDLRVSFAGNAESLQRYGLKARFSGLGLKAQGYFPGFFGISGSLEASEKGGSVTLRSQVSGLDLPSVFPEPRLSFDSLSAQAQWKIAGPRVDVDLNKIEFAGADAAGFAQGTYRFTGEGPGVIDLTANLSRADGRAVWRYMPHVVNADARAWLRRGITSGKASDARLTLKGDLARFPFLDGSGTFLVTAKAHDVTLDYAPGWPRLEHIDGDLRFAGAGMRVDARKGELYGTRISETVAEIPDFDAEDQRLTVRGKVEGATADFLRFVDNSPVAQSIEQATSDMRAEGQGTLDLALDIPLSHAEDAAIKGEYRFIDNKVFVDPVLPPMTQVNGLLHFTENDITVREIGGQFLNGPVKVKAETRGGRVEVVATGSLSVAQARKTYDLPLFNGLSGSTHWRAEVKAKKRSAEVQVESSLVGISSSLPVPFNKTATEPLPLRFDKLFTGGEPGARGPKGGAQDRTTITLGKIAQAQLLRRREAGGKVLVPERGAIAIGTPMQLPERGILATLAVPALDADFWRRALVSPGANGNGGAAGNGGEPLTAFLPDRIDLRTAQLDVFGRSLHEVELKAQNPSQVWQVRLASKEANGELSFDPFGRGALRARLRNLNLEAPAGEAKSSAAEVLEELPALDVVAENFSLGTKKMGRLEVQARNEASNWRIEKLVMSNPEGRLEGVGAWRMQEPRQFALDFSLDASDVGGLLDRLGFAGAVRRGTATLGGKLSWNGVPTHIDYPSLSGELRVEASRGQFARLDPGAGKLLGLMSLQSLPRRITLDFRDVFSDGFAFDSIASQLDVRGGVMRTDRLQIDGPSARVLMKGEVDLERETQKMVVNVQPELGGTAALGVALANPIAGVVTLLAHKVLQNPLNQIFSFDYAVTGTWADPRVDRLSTQRLAPQTGSSGEQSETGNR